MGIETLRDICAMPAYAFPSAMSCRFVRWLPKNWNLFVRSQASLG